MADPMLTINGSDTGSQRVVKHNENVRRRFAVEPRFSLDASTTQTSSDELLEISATSAVRTLTLLPVATANPLWLVIVAADVTNTVVVDPDGSEQIEGASTKTYTAAKRLYLVPNGTQWRVFDMT